MCFVFVYHISVSRDTFPVLSNRRASIKGMSGGEVGCVSTPVYFGVMAANGELEEVVQVITWEP